MLAKPIKVAILDMYNRAPNQGMRCIQAILDEYVREIPAALTAGVPVELSYEVFETRYANEVPGPEFDVYISTGGPGSPFDGEGLAWESRYFHLLDALWSTNQRPHGPQKHVFFICHSFQMMCRHFQLGEVNRRRSTAFGIFPTHETEQGMAEPVFQGLPDPFYAVDSRDWQVVQPDQARLDQLGATVVALEKARPHVDLERAVMAIRLSEAFFGTQFHPEADAQGMSVYFQQADRRQQIIDTYGEKKYLEMLHYLSDPQKIALTQRTILPAFLNQSIRQVVEAS